MLRLTATPTFKTLSHLPCLLNKCSINPHLFHCGFNLFKDRVQQPAPLLAHANPLQIREKATFLQADLTLQDWAKGVWDGLQSLS